MNDTAFITIITNLQKQLELISTNYMQITSNEIMYFAR